MEAGALLYPCLTALFSRSAVWATSEVCLLEGRQSLGNHRTQERWEVAVQKTPYDFNPMWQYSFDDANMTKSMKILDSNVLNFDAVSQNHQVPLA